MAGTTKSKRKTGDAERPKSALTQKSLAREVYLRIKDEILLNRLPPGVILDEVGLAKRYKVSRTPVREALRGLEQDGLVTTLARRGTFVRRPTLQDVVDIDLIRLLLEPAAARLAAGRANADELAEVTAQISDLLAKETNDDVTFLQVDWRLHDLILRASGNAHLRRVVNSLRDRIAAVRRPSAVRVRLPESLKELQQIAFAIRDGDAEKAEALMKGHLASAMKNRRRLYEGESADTPTDEHGFESLEL